MSMFLMPAPDGSCQVCAVKHTPVEPHNAQSMPYQVWFKNIYGRSPTWADAIAHCSQETQKKWKEKLIELKAWTEPEDKNPIASVDKSGGKPMLRELTESGPVVIPLKKRAAKK